MSVSSEHQLFIQLVIDTQDTKTPTKTSVIRKLIATVNFARQQNLYHKSKIDAIHFIVYVSKISAFLNQDK